MKKGSFRYFLSVDSSLKWFLFIQENKRKDMINYFLLFFFYFKNPGVKGGTQKMEEKIQQEEKKRKK